MPSALDTAHRDRQQPADGGRGDLPVRLTGTRGWIAVAVVTTVVIAGIVWGVTATLSRSVSAAGLLTCSGGAFAVQAPVGGTVTDVLTRPGDRVERGAPVVRVSGGGLTTTIPAPAGGRAFSVSARVGEVISPGDDLVDAERCGVGERPVAVLYLPADVPAALSPGAKVTMTVQSAPVNQFGVLYGRVITIDAVMSAKREVAEFVGDVDLATALVGPGGGRRVVVQLDLAPTPSGFRWSTADGPPFPIASRTQVVGVLPMPPEHPINWVVPK